MELNDLEYDNNPFSPPKPITPPKLIVKNSYDEITDENIFVDNNIK